MFEYLYEWLQNLAFYMILVTAIMHVIPSGGYEKYIRFFCGLILVILLAAPLCSMFGAGTQFQKVYKEAEDMRLQREMEEAAAYIENMENPFQE
ncbi:stage III sporulation protein AF [Roseburia hominis]